MDWIVLVLAMGFVTAFIATKRDPSQSFSVWFIYGALLFVVALPHSLLFKPRSASTDRFFSRPVPTTPHMTKEEYLAAFGPKRPTLSARAVGKSSRALEKHPDEVPADHG